MPRQKLTASVILVAALLLCTPAALNAQYAINPIAGGGPNNLPALSSSIGFTGGVVSDTLGNTYVADVNSSRIFKIGSTGTVTVFAGNESGIGGEGGYSGDGGPATLAQLGRPEGIAVDTLGDVFIADTENSVIRKVTAASGTITTVAGVAYTSSQTCNYSGDGALATSAQLCRPGGVFVDAAGDIFIADTENSVIREVVAATGNIQTVAGNNTLSAGYSGDLAAATAAQLDLPTGVFVDSSGNIFIADTYNSVIRKVTAATGIIQTVAGAHYVFGAVATPNCQFSGDAGLATAAQLCLPGGVSVDSSGDIFIADTENSVIREVVAATGDIQTVAGNATLGAGYSGDGAAATSAQLNLPNGLFVDSLGNIFIADTDNFVIREVSAGTIQTFAGNHTVAYSGDGGVATNASLYAPGSVFVDASDDIFIADTENHAVRKITAGSSNIQTVAGNGTGGNTGDGALATAAELSHPFGVFVDSLGDIFIADTGNSTIRCVVGTAGGCFGSALAVGDITTVAGTGTAGSTGDGGLATAAQLSNPHGVFVDAAGNLFIADTDNSEIRCVVGAAGGCFGSTLAVGSITTVAGTGTACQPGSGSCGDGGAATSAQLNFPAGIFGDTAGDLFIADTLDSEVREILAATHNIQTVAGSSTAGYSGDEGPATSAQLNDPYGVFVDRLGNIFIADTGNSVVREVVAITGNIQTAAGNGTAGYSGDAGPASSAQLDGPLSVTGDAAGNLFVADSQNSRIRELTSTASVTLIPTSATLPTGTSQQFAATVTGANDTSVTWQVNGVTGGNNTAGLISTLGSYQAPTDVPTPATVTVTAIANANGVASASALVTIVVGSTTPTVTVSTDLSVTEVYTNATQTFIANVTDAANPAVNWQVNGVLGGNSTVGTISTDGIYSAPATVPTPATVTVSAALQMTPTVSASYPIQIVAAPAAPSPAPQTISAGASATFAISLAAKTGAPKQAITLSCLKSSLPLNATCTFAPPTIVPGSSAVPFSLTISVPSCAAAALDKSKSLFLASRFFVLFLPMAAILFIDKRKKHRYSLLMLILLCTPLALLVSCGGSGGGGSQASSCANPTGTFNVVVQGTTKAQPNPVTIVTVNLTVQ
jgi:hypothetical protein